MIAKKIPLATCHPCEKELEYINEAFQSNWIAPLGPHVNEFEKEMASYAGVAYGAATASGTSAIHLALIEAGVKSGDIVLCSDMTFSASCNPIIYQNAIPVFVDANKKTFDIDVESLEIAFNKYPTAKALIVVHLFGQPCDMDPIVELCKKHNCILIEDAAEALGSTYNCKKCGSFGKFGIYSFNGNKIITTSGGGMVVSNEQEAINHIRFLSTQARDKAPWYQHSQLGFNYRMSNICAAIGRAQLLDLERRINKKREIYFRYLKAFEETDIEMMPLCENGVSNCWLSAMTIKEGVAKSPFDLLNYLLDKNIESRPIWKPMHLQPFYEKYDFISSKQNEPMDESIFARGLCLPSDIEMTVEEQDYVIKTIKEFMSK